MDFSRYFEFITISAVLIPVLFVLTKPAISHHSNTGRHKQVLVILNIFLWVFTLAWSYWVFLAMIPVNFFLIIALSRKF